VRCGADLLITHFNREDYGIGKRLWKLFSMFRFIIGDFSSVGVGPQRVDVADPHEIGSEVQGEMKMIHAIAPGRGWHVVTAVDRTIPCRPDQWPNREIRLYQDPWQYQVLTYTSSK